jgi:demethylmenaquinone methyltransferase / 2-methoxy-6-polyprenyl-1,4-benzoquinol methylase
MPEKIPSSVLGLYDGIFHCYDAANTFLTFGLDGVWRRAAARRAMASSPGRVLDVCCGTGALTTEIWRLSRGSGFVTGLDLSEAMLSRARLKVPGEAGTAGIKFIEGDATRLPFPDSSFDALTISFATRNLGANGGDLLNYFSEFRRALRPGGVFVHLETSQPANRYIRRLFRAYAGAITSAVGMAFPRGKTAYGFLAGTMASFHGPEELSALILKAGFSKVEYRPMMFGAVALHTAVK